jgi:potassium/hydrogen antiporter
MINVKDCSMTPNSLEEWVLVGSVLVLAAVLAVRLATRTGLPSLLLFLGLGLLLGEAGLGHVQFSDYDLTRDLGLAALAIILAEGGLTTRWKTMRPVVGFATVLATLGVFVSIAVVTAAGYYFLDLDLRTAMLAGAVVASTDAAAVFSVLRKLPLQPRLGATLEAESGLNDAPAVIIVTVVASSAWAEKAWGHGIVEIGLELVIGVVLGVAMGWLGAQLLNRSALPTAGLYPLATLAIALATFAATNLLHGSGFLAVYLCTVVLGNSTLPHRNSTVAFVEGAALLAQIGLFVLLGVLASPSKLPEVIVPALVIGGVLTFVARPLSVALCALPFRRPATEVAFLSWAGLRGAVPIVLATIPVSVGVAGADKVFNIVFVLVVVYTLLQAPTLPWLARRLGVTTGAPREVQVESAPLDELRADLVQFVIPENSLLHGVYVDELLLPVGAQVSLVVRDGASLELSRDLRLHRGDQILIVTTREVRDLVAERLQAVSDAGRLAQWRAETTRRTSPPHPGGSA